MCGGGGGGRGGGGEREIIVWYFVINNVFLYSNMQVAENYTHTLIEDNSLIRACNAHYPTC